MNRLECIAIIALAIITYGLALHCGINRIIPVWTMFGTAMFAVAVGTYFGFKMARFDEQPQHLRYR